MEEVSDLDVVTPRIVMSQVLTDKSFMLYAAKAYDNPRATSLEEFHEDLKRIKYVKKLLTRYQERGELKERLIINHLVILCNMFGPGPLCRMLWLKMRSQLSYVVPFLVYLSYLPDVISDVGEPGQINTCDVVMDQGIVDALRRI